MNKGQEKPPEQCLVAVEIGKSRLTCRVVIKIAHRKKIDFETFQRIYAVVLYPLSGCILQLDRGIDFSYFAVGYIAHLNITLSTMSTGFNDKIRAIRMMRGIKQSEIARLLDVRQQSISKIENGKIRIDQEVAETIAQYFGFAGRCEMEAFYEKYISKNKTPEKETA